MSKNKEEKEPKKEFVYDIDDSFDYIIDEGGNTSINVRKISWNGKPYKLDIRRYTYKDGEEKMMKGISLSDEASDELTKVLIDNGYGNTKYIINSLKNRDDFKESLLEDNNSSDVNNNTDDEDEEYYDPKELLG